MEVVYMICFFIIGTMLGSFYNVVGYRIPKGNSIVKPGSHCDHCGHSLKARDLIPVLSYCLQRGKCRYCHQKISPMDPIIELSTGLLFMIAYYSFGFSVSLLIALAIISLFMIVIVSDLNFLIIPDEVVLVFSILLIVLQFIQLGPLDALLHIASGVFTFAVMYGLMRLGNQMFQKESLGGGDVKLMFIVGLVLGPVLGLFNIFLSSFLALPVSIVLFLRKKENVIPFGPFILLAMVLLYLMKIDPLFLEALLNF